MTFYSLLPPTDPQTLNLVVSLNHLIELVLSLFVAAELPYGWEKIDDPIYGSYYVE